MNYQNFDLEIISSQGDQSLHARVLESPQGDSPFIDVAWPFEAEEENEFLAEIYGGLRQRRGRSAKVSTIQDFGGKLFDAVFTGDIEHLFRASLDAAHRAGTGLRIRLRLPDDSALHSRPWEFLFDTESREFLAVREHTPLVRYLPVAQPIPPITVEGPLRILVALAAPSDHPRLDVAREWEILMNALEAPVSAGQVELRRVPGRCTFDNLRDSLRHFNAHIFHFIGHGIPGALVLEQETGKGMEMEATHLRSAFPSGALPRLIVLNSCSGAIGEDMPFSGLAQGFLRQGVPAVVAMQASITDDAALIFTRYFYRDLIETGTVDASLTEARLRMQGNGHPIEWGTPVLYMRALSGQLFKPGANLNERKPSTEAPLKEIVMPRPEPVAHDRNKRQREVLARDSTPAPRPRPEPGPTERKRQKDPPKKENPPSLHPPPGPGERKNPGKIRVAEPALPIKLEPKMDTSAPPPPLRPEPRFDIPDVPVKLPPSPPQAVNIAPAEEQSPLVKMVVRYWPAAGLAAFSLVAIGVYMVVRDRPAPSPAKPSAILLPSPSPPSPAPSVVPRPSAPVTVSKPDGAGRAPSLVEEKAVEIPAKRPDIHVRSPATRKVVTQQAARKPTAPAPTDNCNDPDVSARRIDCLLKK
jgi:hypothetical protein